MFVREYMTYGLCFVAVSVKVAKISNVKNVIWFFISRTSEYTAYLQLCNMFVCVYDESCLIAVPVRVANIQKVEYVIWVFFHHPNYHLLFCGS